MTETINNVHDIRAAVERAIRFHAPLRAEFDEGWTTIEPDELRQAWLVDPYDINGMKSALLEAYQAESKETTRRMKAMRRTVTQHDVAALLAPRGRPPRPHAERLAGRGERSALRDHRPQRRRQQHRVPARADRGVPDRVRSLRAGARCRRQARAGHRRDHRGDRRPVTHAGAGAQTAPPAPPNVGGHP